MSDAARFEIMLTAYPGNQRERDEQAIQWLCEVLDKGGHPGTGWPFIREPWSTILQRRIANNYSPQRTARAMWTWRHYHVRQLAYREGPEESAEHVATAWTKNGRRVTAETILAAAKLAKNKRAALDWIAQVIQSERGISIPGRPVATELQIYQALDRAIERDIAPAFSAPGTNRAR